MGAAKSNVTAITTKGAGAFSPAYVAEMDLDRCISHCVAFERIFGWPLHVTLIGDEIFRCHNEGNRFLVYDVRGILHPPAHAERVIRPIIQADQRRLQTIYPLGAPTETSCCGVEGLAEHDLEIDEAAIARCDAEIRSNTIYSSLVPLRPAPWRPARIVRQYAFANCIAFAEALSRVRKLHGVVVSATQVHPDIELGKDKFHAGVLHENGTIEDVWGLHPIEIVAHGYGMSAWEVCEETFRSVVADAQRDVPTFESNVLAAMSFI